MNNFLSNRSTRPRLGARIYLGTGFLLLLLLQSVASFSQKITLNYQNVPLEQVLKEIHKQSGYDIFFDQTLVSQQPLVAIKVTNADVEEAMVSVLKGLSLSFEVNRKTISIKRKEKVISADIRQQKITITGTVIDDNGLPLAGVSVSTASVKPIYTDGEGKFTLKDIDPLAMIRISYTGKLTIERTALAISLLGQIAMESQSINLNPTIIQGQRVNTSSVIKVDLSHRRQLNLATALESTIPGLVLKNQRSITTKRFFRAGSGATVAPGDYSLEELTKIYYDYFLSLSQPISMEQAKVYAEETFSTRAGAGDVISQSTVNNNGLIPELRGPGGFGAGNNAMLVVIDGFVQEGFPADYPLNNVLSIEVIRDPAETIKWGPAAANGVIIITTNGGKPGDLQISYNSNFNFSGAPDNSAAALQRANTSQILDYYLDEDKLVPSAVRSNVNYLSGSLVPARMLLEERYANRNDPGAEQIFQNNWKLLSQLSNEEQYRQQQQGIFNQTQNLNLSGGGKHQRFSLNGSYSTSHSEVLGNRGREWAVNFRDQLSLLENKLQVVLQLNARQSRNVAGNALDPAQLEPYQMLYRPDGSYVYDYTVRGINERQNMALKQANPGLQDFGYNPLEDARGTQNLSKGRTLNSSLNIDWKLLKGLTWSANLQYINSKTNNENLWAQNTRYVGDLYNGNFGSYTVEPHPFFPSILVPVPTDPPIAFVPLGNVFQGSQNRRNSSNMRTGFTYNNVFNKKHALNVRLGFSYFDQLVRSSTDLPLYGYNSTTELGTALSLPAPTARYLNPLKASINFSKLSAIQPINRRPERNLSANANLDYIYDGRLGLQTFYNESFMPVPTAEVYSSTRNYNALASWALHKESFFKFPMVSKLKLTAGFGEIKMASLPVNMPATREFDSIWGTYLTVTGYNTVRQNGEQIRNYDALLDLGMFKDILQAQLNYRYNSMGVKNQLSGRVSYHISKASYFKLPWVSNLVVEGLVTNISPAQALAQMMSTNSPLAGGGFSAATGNFDMGALPAHIKNKEISLRFGLWKDRLNVDVRHYNRSNSGTANSSYQTDLSTGFSQRAQYSRIDNKGYELYLQAKILQGDGFTWNSTVNAAYNINLAKDVVKPLYIKNTRYLTADRSGYATGSLWSYRWAGLNHQGQPQIFDPNGKAVEFGTLTAADENWVEYSGRTTPPWSGAFIQEFGYKRFYARATLRFALGHVMRTYRPTMAFYQQPKSNLIAKRWRNPGDEVFTDIPAFSVYNDGKILTLQNSSNSIAPADFFRLTEIQFGYDVPVSWLKSRYLKSLNLAFNMQNVGLWTRNKLGIDPEAILPDGKLLVRQPLRYGISLNVGL